jgi:hypothetical protein
MAPSDEVVDAAPAAAKQKSSDEAKLKFIARKVAANECVLFLGSAIHAPSPAGSIYNYTDKKCPPIGNQLAKLLAKESGYNDEEKTLQRVSQHFEFNLTRQPLIAAIEKYVSEGTEPSPVLYALASLKFPLVITTNYDKLYEQAIDTINKRRAIEEAKKAGVPYDEAAIENETKERYDISIYSRDRTKKTVDCPKQLNPDRPFILKIHGDIKEPKSIVITDEDYIQFVLRMGDKERYHPVGPNVTTHLLEHTILFIGYRLNDYNLRLLFKTLRWKKDAEDVVPAFAVDRDPDYLIRDVWERSSYIKFLVEDLWSFVPNLYREVKNEEMPS